MPATFISYRREDSSSESGRLHSTIIREFGSEAVFMDTSGIHPGETWPKKLEDALQQAQIVLVVIGPEWLRASNQWGQRRLDEEGDWVRKEIELALSTKKELLPMLVGGAKLPPRERLPASIGSIVDRQAVEIRDNYWDNDVRMIVERLRSLLPPLREGKIEPGLGQSPYPNPPAEKPDPVSDDKLAIALSGTLSGWRKIASVLPERPADVRIELHRSFQFRTFADAIRFMGHVAPGCDIASHHPRWENIWKTVNVYLTTWDIGHRVSDRDIQLAKYFDSAYREFPAARPDPKKPQQAD